MENKYVVYILCSLMGYFSVHIYFSTFAPKGSVFTRRKWCIMFFCFLIDCYIYYACKGGPSVLMSVATIILEIILGLLHDIKFKRCILLYVLMLSIASVCDVVAPGFVAHICGQNLITFYSDFDTYVISMLLNQILFLIMVTLLHVFFQRKEFMKRPAGYWQLVGIMPFGSMYIMYFLLTRILTNYDGNYVDFMLCAVILCIMNMMTLSFYDRICRDQMVKEERDQLQQYVELQKNQQQRVDYYNKRIARMRHDMKNYLAGITELVEEQKYEKALSELKNVNQEFLAAPKVFSTGDSMLNQILNAKLWEMKEKGILLESAITLSGEIPMSAGELSVLLGNLLDNAIEYLESHKMAEQKVELVIHYDYGMLSIMEENAVEEEMKIPKDMLIPTTKKKGMHGIGISSMKEIAHRYHGDFQITCREKRFRLETSFVLNEEGKDK